MNCLNQDSQDDERAYLKRARRNRDREVVSTGKEVSDDKRLLILEILLQTTENAGGHTNPATTNVARGAAITNRRGFPRERLQAKVKVSIHAADWTLVRTLELGQMPAGVYQSLSRSAYWDGRKARGESVASGVYFYTLQADGFSSDAEDGDTAVGETSRVSISRR